MKSRLEDECQNVMMCPLKVCSKKSTFHVILQGIIRKLEGKIHFLIAHVMDIKIGAVWNISQKKRFCL